eukprot:Platyproteum_vivax@DN6415_c0_g1_i1.p1
MPNADSGTPTNFKETARMGQTNERFETTNKIENGCQTEPLKCSCGLVFDEPLIKFQPKSDYGTRSPQPYASVIKEKTEATNNKPNIKVSKSSDDDIEVIKVTSNGAKRTRTDNEDTKPSKETAKKGKPNSRRNEEYDNLLCVGCNIGLNDLAGLVVRCKQCSRYWHKFCCDAQVCTFWEPEDLGPCCSDHVGNLKTDKDKDKENIEKPSKPKSKEKPKEKAKTPNANRRLKKKQASSSSGSSSTENESNSDSDYDVKDDPSAKKKQNLPSTDDSTFKPAPQMGSYASAFVPPKKAVAAKRKPKAAPKRKAAPTYPKSGAFSGAQQQWQSAREQQRNVKQAERLADIAGEEAWRGVAGPLKESGPAGRTIAIKLLQHGDYLRRNLKGWVAFDTRQVGFQSVTEDDVKASYKRWMLLAHPDKNQDHQDVAKVAIHNLTELRDMMVLSIRTRNMSKPGAVPNSSAAAHAAATLMDPPRLGSVTIPYNSVTAAGVQLHWSVRNQVHLNAWHLQLTAAALPLLGPGLPIVGAEPRNLEAFSNTLQVRWDNPGPGPNTYWNVTALLAAKPFQGGETRSSMCSLTLVVDGMLRTIVQIDELKDIS